MLHSVRHALVAISLVRCSVPRSYPMILQLLKLRGLSWLYRRLVASLTKRAFALRVQTSLMQGSNTMDFAEHDLESCLDSKIPDMILEIPVYQIGRKYIT